MVPLTALWLPILLSAVAVFIASSIVHMVLPLHRGDYKRLPDEEKLLEALRSAGVAPGAYMFPCPEDFKDMGSSEMAEKYTKGPVGMMTVLPNGPPMMAKHLVMWFVYCLVIGFFLAYIAGRTLSAGVDYLAVFRVVGATGFLAYAGAYAADPIWRGASWPTTSKFLFDGLLYGLITAGVFGWLWPQ